MDKWDLVQWGYIVIMALVIYFDILAWIWLKSKKWRADPFFYYLIILINSIGIARLGVTIARHYFLCGDQITRDMIISSWWWAARNVVPFAILIVLNIHATIRYCRQKNNSDKHRRIGD